MIADEKVRDAAHVYAQNPNAQNLGKAAPSQSLSPQDHALVQDMAGRKVAAILSKSARRVKRSARTAAGLS